MNESMSKIASDFEIINEIYNRYRDTYHSFATENPEKITRIRVPIDIGEIAKACGVGEEMVFGRLYYHFNKKYSYKDEEGRRITFFASVKFEGLSVNFPMVASILADLRAEQRKFRIATSMALASLLISVATLTYVLMI